MASKVISWPWRFNLKWEEDEQVGPMHEMLRVGLYRPSAIRGRPLLSCVLLLLSFFVVFGLQMPLFGS